MSKTLPSSLNIDEFTPTSHSFRDLDDTTFEMYQINNGDVAKFGRALK